jgi:hypothetical protein
LTHHGDKVLADRVVAIMVDGEAELGADAVGGRDQQRIRVAGGARIEKAPKPPRSAAAPGRAVSRASGAMARTSALPAAMSTPASA